MDVVDVNGMHQNLAKRMKSWHRDSDFDEANREWTNIGIDGYRLVVTISIVRCMLVRFFFKTFCAKENHGEFKWTQEPPIEHLTAGKD